MRCPLLAYRDARPHREVAARDVVQTVNVDVKSIITNHKLGLPLDHAAGARLTADEREVERPATTYATETGPGLETQLKLPTS